MAPKMQRRSQCPIRSSDQHQSDELRLNAQERDSHACGQAGIPRTRIRPADTWRSDNTATAPLKVKAPTTSPPTIGCVTPVAARTSDGISEK